MALRDDHLPGLEPLPHDFSIEFDVEARTLTPQGDFDVATSPILLAAAKAFTEETPGDLTIDLADVSFGDSSLVGALVDLRLDQQEQGHTLTVVNQARAIRRLFLQAGFQASE